MTDGEKSDSGQPIYRYDKKNDFQAPPEDSNLEAIENHIETHVGPVELVYHELVSDKVHLDIHLIKPDDNRPFNTLVTSGMSDRAMTTPDEVEEAEYAELVAFLPPDWKLSEEDFKDENNYWPLRWLKIMARFPHDYNTWLGWGHTIPNGDPPRPFTANTKQCGMLLLPVITLTEDFQQLQTPDGKLINFFCMFPLYKEEMDLKLSKGTDDLIAKFEKHNVHPNFVDPSRTNACKPKRFGLF